MEKLSVRLEHSVEWNGIVGKAMETGQDLEFTITWGFRVNECIKKLYSCYQIITHLMFELKIQ